MSTDMEKYLHDCESRVRQDVYSKYTTAFCNYFSNIFLYLAFQSGEPSQAQVIATTSKACKYISL